MTGDTDGSKKEIGKEEGGKEEGGKEEDPNPAAKEEQEVEVTDTLTTNPHFVALQKAADDASEVLSKKVSTILLAVLALIWGILSAQEGILAAITHRVGDLLLWLAALAVVGLVTDACQYVFIYILAIRTAKAAEKEAAEKEAAGESDEVLVGGAWSEDDGLYRASRTAFYAKLVIAALVAILTLAAVFYGYTHVPTDSPEAEGDGAKTNK